MRKFALLSLLLVAVVPSLFAQNIDTERDESWRRRRGVYDDRRPENRFELTPFGGYRYGGTLWADRSDLFGRDVDIASASNAGVSFGIPIGDTSMKLELMANRQSTHFAGGSGLFEPDLRLADVDISYYHAGLQFPFGSPRSVSPFFVVSAGVANIDPEVRNASAENRFSASAGVGLKIPVNRNLGFRFEARGYFTSLGEDYDDGCFDCYDAYNHDLYQGETNFGLVISF